jgi:hypothetical protein
VWKSTVNLQLLIVDDAGKDVLRKGRKVTFTEKPSGTGRPGHVRDCDQAAAAVAPGGWLSCRIEDMNAPRSA